jgi:hypothetical protein
MPDNKRMKITPQDLIKAIDSWSQLAKDNANSLDVVPIIDIQAQILKNIVMENARDKIMVQQLSNEVIKLGGNIGTFRQIDTSRAAGLADLLEQVSEDNRMVALAIDDNRQLIFHFKDRSALGATFGIYLKDDRVNGGNQLSALLTIDQVDKVFKVEPDEQISDNVMIADFLNILSEYLFENGYVYTCAGVRVLLGKSK